MVSRLFVLAKLSNPSESLFSRNFFTQLCPFFCTFFGEVVNENFPFTVTNIQGTQLFSFTMFCPRLLPNPYFHGFFLVIFFSTSDYELRPFFCTFSGENFTNSSQTLSKAHKTFSGRFVSLLSCFLLFLSLVFETKLFTNISTSPLLFLF